MPPSLIPTTFCFKELNNLNKNMLNSIFTEHTTFSQAVISTISKSVPWLWFCGRLWQVKRVERQVVWSVQSSQSRKQQLKLMVFISFCSVLTFSTSVSFLIDGRGKCEKQKTYVYSIPQSHLKWYKFWICYTLWIVHLCLSYRLVFSLWKALSTLSFTNSTCLASKLSLGITVSGKPL